jgi:hypothetical protein
MKGFYFFRPEDSNSWRIWNYGCVYFYYPLITVEEWLGTVDGIGCEPMWRLSGSSTPITDTPAQVLNEAFDLVHTGSHPATVYLDQNLRVISVFCCPLCSAETEPEFRIKEKDGTVSEKDLPSATVMEGKRRLAEYRSQPEFQRKAAAWKSLLNDQTKGTGRRG